MMRLLQDYRVSAAYLRGESIASSWSRASRRPSSPLARACEAQRAKVDARRLINPCSGFSSLPHRVAPWRGPPLQALVGRGGSRADNLRSLRKLDCRDSECEPVGDALQEKPLPASLGYPSAHAPPPQGGRAERAMRGLNQNESCSSSPRPSGYCGRVTSVGWRWQRLRDHPGRALSPSASRPRSAASASPRALGARMEGAAIDRRHRGQVRHGFARLHRCWQPARVGHRGEVAVVGAIQSAPARRAKFARPQRADQGELAPATDRPRSCCLRTRSTRDELWASFDLAQMPWSANSA